MPNQLHGPLTPSPIFEEYVAFCEQENITPVPYEEFTADRWLQLCKEYGVQNAVNDANGIPWTFFQKKFGTMFATAPTDDAS